MRTGIRAQCRRWSTLALVLALVIWLGGCGMPAIPAAAPPTTPAPASIKPTITARPAADLIERWLAGSVCRAPCWEGITPGHTSASAAITAIKNNPFVDQARFPGASSDTEIGWFWANGAPGVGEMRFSQPVSNTASVVSWMLIDLPRPVTLGEVISAYGQPSHVIAHKFRGFHGDGPFYALSLVYEPQGFWLEPGRITDQKPVLNDRLLLRKLFFSTAPWVPGELGPNGMVAWQGFNDIAVYCRDAEQGQLCAEEAPNRH